MGLISFAYTSITNLPQCKNQATYTVGQLYVLGWYNYGCYIATRAIAVLYFSALIYEYKAMPFPELDRKVRITLVLLIYCITKQDNENDLHVEMNLIM